MTGDNSLNDQNNGNYNLNLCTRDDLLIFDDLGINEETLVQIQIRNINYHLSKGNKHLYLNESSREDIIGSERLSTMNS
jgi:hypothetical protein